MLKNDKQLMYARLYYILWYIIAGGALSIIPIYIDEINFTASQTGIFLAVPSFTMLLQPIWGAVSDKFKIPRLIVIIGILVSAVFIALIPVVANTFEGNDNLVFTLVTLTYVVACLFRAPVINTTDNLVFTMASKKNYPYGKLRMFGSFSWGGAMLILSPLLIFYGTQSFFWFTLVGSIVVAFFVYKLPNSTSIKEDKSGKKVNLKKEFINLMRNKNYLMLLIFTIIFSMLMPINIPYTSLYVGDITSNSDVNFLVVNSTFITALIIFFSTLPEMIMLVKYEVISRKLGVMGGLILATSFILIKYLVFALTSNIILVFIFSLLHGCGMGLYTPLLLKSVKTIVDDKISVFGIMIIGFFNAIAGIVSSMYVGVLREENGFFGVFSYGVVIMSIALIWLFITYKPQFLYFKNKSK